MRTDDQGNVSIELAWGLAEEVVRTFGEVRLRVFGTSMVADYLSRGDQVSSVTAVMQSSSVVVEIGGLPIRLRCDNPAFVRQIEERYAGYVSLSNEARFDFEIELAPPGTKSRDADVCVKWESGHWLMERGEFRAEWNPSTARGRIQQTINPYSLDCVLRIVHTLLL